MKSSSGAGHSPWIILLTLVIAGEAVFALPFHVVRFFRPTLLSALEINNAELGWMQSAYGFAAMLAYAPGGWIADRVPARTLLPVSLGLTALGGLYFATFPGRSGMLALHLYWGVTTILLFWGALIRATREDGPDSRQGRTFGLLDGGRGLLAATVATAGLFLLGDEPETALSLGEQRERLRAIIWLYTAVTVVVAGLCWWVLGGFEQEGIGSEPQLVEGDSLATDSREQARASVVNLHGEPQGSSALRRHLLHGAVIVAAYCGYKGLDFSSTFATEVFAQTDIEGAKWATWSVWLRPPSALIAGMLADRFSAGKMSAWSLWGLCALYSATAVALYGEGVDAELPVFILGVNILGTSVLLYGLRALYFALLAETGVPRHATGFAVGVVSVIGYTPDFFFPALAGSLVESEEGARAGYAGLYILLAAFSLLGGWAALRLRSKAMPSAHRRRLDL